MAIIWVMTFRNSSWYDHRTEWNRKTREKKTTNNHVDYIGFVSKCWFFLLQYLHCAFNTLIIVHYMYGVKHWHTYFCWLFLPLLEHFPFFDGIGSIKKIPTTFESGKSQGVRLYLPFVCECDCECECVCKSERVCFSIHIKYTW